MIRCHPIYSRNNRICFTILTTIVVCQALSIASLVQGSTQQPQHPVLLFQEEMTASYTRNSEESLVNTFEQSYDPIERDSDSTEARPEIALSSNEGSQDTSSSDQLNIEQVLTFNTEKADDNQSKSTENKKSDQQIKSIQSLRLVQVLQPGVDRHSRKPILLHHEPPASQQIFVSDRSIKYSKRSVKKWSSLVARQKALRAENLNGHLSSMDMSPISEEMYVPDHQDRDTVIRFALLTYDSYYEPEDKNWKPVPGWNVTGRFGWDGTGIRGYLFVDESEEVLIIVIKGTSLATPIGSGPTAIRDKLNDNMMFSCCCAKAGWEWRPICDCPQSGYTCSMKCLLRESNFEESYYNLAQTIYLAVKEWFPRHTSVWMSGHSLGGALSSLVALTNDLPSFAYEAPGDMLYASRLGLLPDLEDPTEFLNSLPIYHYGNDGDPIFLGQCTGVTSSCYWLDYALESKCHLGHECMYPSNPKNPRKRDDTSKDSSIITRSSGRIQAMKSIQYHSIDYVIKNIMEKMDHVPKCIVKPKCLESECVGWTFVDDL